MSHFQKSVEMRKRSGGCVLELGEQLRLHRSKLSASTGEDAFELSFSRLQLNFEDVTQLFVLMKRNNLEMMIEQSKVFVQW